MRSSLPAPLFLLFLLLTHLSVHGQGNGIPRRYRGHERTGTHSAGIAWRAQQRHKRNRASNALRSAQTTERISALNEQARERLSVSPSSCAEDIHMDMQCRNVSAHLFLELFRRDGVIPMHTDEGKQRPCSFLGASCPMERIEHQLVSRFVRPEDSVLELGARFGTTSCAIAAQQRNSGRLVVVEPDSSVWFLLQQNRRKHRCAFWTFRGAVVANEQRSRGVSLSKASYATRTVALQSNSSSSSLQRVQSSESTPPPPPVVLPTMSMANLQNATSLRFDVLLVDCEGCIESFLPSSPNELAVALRHVKTIILEADMSVRDPLCASDCVDYAKWIALFEKLGFSIRAQVHDDEFPGILHFAFQRS